VCWIALLILLHVFELITPLYIVPFLVLFFISILLWIRNKNNALGFSSLIQRMTIPGLLIFSISNFSIFVQRIDFKLTKIDAQVIEQTTSEDELVALEWISHHSDQDAIVATNRSLCESSPLCVRESSSHLVSAVSQRRILLEGPYFVPSSMTLSGTYQEWALSRAKTSLGFVDTPSKLLAEQLANYGVTVIYVQKSATDTTSWEPWASIVYENQSAAVLILNS
jgi:hypothetical protein